MVACYSERFGEGAEISVAGSDYLSYEHHRVDVYRHNNNGKLQVVTAGKIVSMEYLTLINGQMAHGSYYSMGNCMSDTLRRG